MIKVYLHYDGEFSPKTFMGQDNYIGGVIDVFEIDTDLFSFRDLEEFSQTYDYGKNALVYFQADGDSFKNGLRVLYDDESVRDMIKVCSPFSAIHLYVDDKKIELGNNGYLDNDDDESESEDSDYIYESETASSDNGSVDNESDDEVVDIKNKKKKFIEELSRGSGFTVEIQENNEEFDFDSDDLRSISSSSKDENHKKGYVGSQPVKSKKRKPGIYNPKKKQGWCN